MTEADLRAAGWSTWYSENYWVHADLVEDPTRQDYTDYGMGFEDAVIMEKQGKPKHKPMGSPGLSRLEMAMRLKTAGAI